MTQAEPNPSTGSSYRKACRKQNACRWHPRISALWTENTSLHKHHKNRSFAVMSPWKISINHTLSRAGAFQEQAESKKETRLRPRSPHACAKDYKILCIGVQHLCLQRVLFNYESPRRGETLVTRESVRSREFTPRKRNTSTL